MKDYDEYEGETPPAHPRPLNLQTKVVVAALGVLIFSTGVLFGVQWHTLTREEVVLPRSPVPTPAPAAPATSTVLSAPVAKPAPAPTRRSEEVNGYHTTYEIDVVTELVTCHAFTVTSTPGPLVSDFLDRIAGGNSVQRTNSEGQLVLNLPWEDLSADDRTVLEGSKPESEETLTITELPTTNRGAIPCQSFVSVRL